MRLLVVTGMHRSGTSLVAGMLRALGWDVGPDEDLMPPKPDNPRGFVEHLPAVRLNDRLLFRHGGAWDRPPAFVPGWEHHRGLDDLREEAAEVVERLDGRNAGPVLVKDPRFSLTLPFWRTVAEIDHVVHVLRAPRPVVRSLTRREDEMDVDAAATLYLRYLSSLLRHDVTQHLVAPDAAIDQLHEQLAAISTELGHDPGDDQRAAAAEQLADGLWGRSSRQPAADEDDRGALDAAVRLHGLITSEDGTAWQAALARLTPVDELVAAGRRIDQLRTEADVTTAELRARVEDLREALDTERQRTTRLVTDRDAARAAHDRMRDKRDESVQTIRDLREQLEGAPSADGPTGQTTPDAGEGRTSDRRGDR